MATNSAVTSDEEKAKAAVQGVYEFRDKLRKEWNKGSKGRDMDLVASYLEEAKLKLIAIKYLERKALDILPEELAVAQDILEIGVFYSILNDLPDTGMFERYMSQLKTYYFDYASKVPVSQHKYEILGANLLWLLTEGRLAEFHTELELILSPGAEEISTNPFVRRAIDLAQALEEGRYKLITEQDGPQKKSALWHVFVTKLCRSSRMEFGDTIEKAYERIGQVAVYQMLNFVDKNEFDEFIRMREWIVRDGFCYFKAGKNNSSFIPSSRLVKESLKYALELEKIV